jgi:hypothetical protein
MYVACNTSVRRHSRYSAVKEIFGLFGFKHYEVHVHKRSDHLDDTITLTLITPCHISIRNASVASVQVGCIATSIYIYTLSSMLSVAVDLILGIVVRHSRRDFYLNHQISNRRPEQAHRNMYSQTQHHLRNSRIKHDLRYLAKLTRLSMIDFFFDIPTRDV